MFPKPNPTKIPELVTHIFRFLNTRDVARAGATCHLWHKAAAVQMEQRFRREIGDPNVLGILPGETWQAAYNRHSNIINNFLQNLLLEGSAINYLERLKAFPDMQNYLIFQNIQSSLQNDSSTLNSYFTVLGYLCRNNLDTPNNLQILEENKDNKAYMGRMFAVFACSIDPNKPEAGQVTQQLFDNAAYYGQHDDVRP